MRAAEAAPSASALPCNEPRLRDEQKVLAPVEAVRALAAPSPRHTRTGRRRSPNFESFHS